MMDDTELAHWRYRVKALARDVEDTQATLRNMRNVTIPWWSPQDFADVEHDLHWQRYLLEEAQYKVELGMVQRGPVGRA